jgi:uncharacterized protein YciI
MCNNCKRYNLKQKQDAMKQYLVTAHDYTTDNALQHRMAVRPFHLEGAAALKASGNFIIGGAMLNDEGRMTGSTMILQFETEAELENWKATEPYITQKVWEKVEVTPFRVANV